ncbi:hypothetical protein SAMN06265337_1226 [Hymenobacter gelipurpurascens]|uniref:Uncharacterized protein n=1 Tax=Hymenobacter gelipurpurascens TaxID=89968 RepID=A0A212TGM3_9BACT|nr:hypothetical protein SAMN06265337_1226 [Hymenobacter gelipurpurascens]
MLPFRESVAPAVLFFLDAGEVDYLVLDLPLPALDQSPSYAAGANLLLTTPVGSYRASLVNQQVACLQPGAHRSRVHLQLYFVQNPMPEPVATALQAGKGISLRLNGADNEPRSFSLEAGTLRINPAIQLSAR